MLVFSFGCFSLHRFEIAKNAASISSQHAGLNIEVGCVLFVLACFVWHVGCFCVIVKLFIWFSLTFQILQFVEAGQISREPLILLKFV